MNTNLDPATTAAGLLPSPASLASLRLQHQQLHAGQRLQQQQMQQQNFGGTIPFPITTTGRIVGQSQEQQRPSSLSALATVAAVPRVAIRNSGSIDSSGDDGSSSGGGSGGGNASSSRVAPRDEAEVAAALAVLLNQGGGGSEGAVPPQYLSHGLQVESYF